MNTASRPASESPHEERASFGAGETRWRRIQWDSVVTRAVDMFVASVALAIFFPLLLVIASAIYLDSGGPAIFRQTRIGKDRRRFTVLKFRSMVKNAPSARHHDYVRRLIEQERQEARQGEGLYKLVVDDRMTRVGRILRRWSLDELPQLVNVLTGSMSLVGPRPVIEYEVDLYPESYMARFDVKPGLTGLWQVSGRNERTYGEMIAHDIEYAETRSLALDLSILMKTVLVVVTRNGAA